MQGRDSRQNSPERAGASGTDAPAGPRRADRYHHLTNDQRAALARSTLASSTPAGEYPHRHTLRAAFAPYNIDPIRAYLDERVAETGRIFESDAYTVGDDVGFTKPPDLRTAAHEAAHVLQQRHGWGGRDSRSDYAERHAETVARNVVERRPVRPLLDLIPLSGKRGGGSTEVLQRRDHLAATAPLSEDEIASQRKILAGEKGTEAKALSDPPNVKAAGALARGRNTTNSCSSLSAKSSAATAT